MVTEFCVPARRHRPLDSVQILVGAGLMGLALLFFVARLAGEPNAGANYVDLWVRFVMFGRASDVLTRTAVRAASVRSGEPCARLSAENP